jgi:plastocyanin
MRRWMLITVLAGAATVFLGMPGAALAGGGCHAPATHADETGQDAATVRLIDACFTASLTTVDPGTAVTFVNEEWTTHNVGGNGWGNFEDMREGDAFTATFTDPGIYPFACTYHPGMTGAIVVGDGTGAGNGSTVSTQPFQPPPPIVTRTVVGAEGLPAMAVLGAGVAGLAIGAAVGVAVRRRAAWALRGSSDR